MGSISQNHKDCFGNYVYDRKGKCRTCEDVGCYGATNQKGPCFCELKKYCGLHRQEEAVESHNFKENCSFYETLKQNNFK